VAVPDPLPQPADPELGLCTHEDDNWGPCPVPVPVSRTHFAMAFAHYGYNQARLTILRLGAHRKGRRWRT
jgi:hypothetical protein